MHIPASIESTSAITESGRLLQSDSDACEESEPTKSVILIVDDQPHVRKLVQSQIEQEYDVVSAGSFSEALAVSSGRLLHAAILDLNLGEDHTGVDLLRSLRERPEHHALYAIAFTAYAHPGTQDLLLKSGFNAFVAKPCRRDHLLQLLREIAAPEKWSGAPAGLRARINLPPLPATIPEIMEMMGRDVQVPDTTALSEILKRDPVTAASVVKHINSAYYNLTIPARTVEHAVALLGFDPVCNLVLTEVFSRSFALKTPKTKRVYDRLMRMTVATAAYARLLAREIGMGHSETLFTCGLFHQIGRLVCLSTDTTRYSEIWTEETQEDGTLDLLLNPDDEFRLYGSDYAHLGADVLHHWNMPEPIAMTVRYQLDPKHAPDAFRFMAFLLSAATQAAALLYESAKAQDLMHRLRKQAVAPLDDLAKEFRTSTTRLLDLIAASRSGISGLVESIVREH